MPPLAVISPVLVSAANVGLSPVATPWFKALTDAIAVSSESIKAPAAVTLVVSVTSAEASMPSSFEPSVARSRPSTVPPTVIFPVAPTVVNDPAAAVAPPITVPSIVPPSMSGVFTSGEVRVLLVSVCEPVRVATVLSIASVTLLPLAVEVTPVLPSTLRASESKSIEMLVVPSVRSKS